MAETTTKKENIETLYHQLESKSDFIRLVAKELKKRPGTLQNHWFSGFFSVPEAHEDRVIELLQNTIKGQNS
jgi:hypothetical protein